MDKATYLVTVFVQQEQFYTYRVDATTEEQAKRLATDKYINGDQSDDYEVVDDFITGSAVALEKGNK